MDSTLPKIPATLSRRATVGAVNADARTVELSFSSETPVERSWGMEILSHAPGACDLSRLNAKGPLLVDHRPEDIVGIVEKSAIGADKRGRAVVRFGKSARANEIFQDVADGIRNTVSISYEIDDMKAVGDGRFLVTRWTPLEVSLVSIPADPTVGVGRSKSPNPQKKNMQIEEVENENEDRGWATRRRDECSPKQEKARVAEISALTKLHTRSAPNPRLEELMTRAILTGDSPDEYRQVLLGALGVARPLTPAELNPIIGMNSRESAAFSVLKALREASEGKLSGLEKEASDAYAKVAGRTRDQNSFFIPGDVLRSRIANRSALNVNTGSAGGFLVDTDIDGSNMIELLRNKMTVASMGARVLGGLTGNLALPRLSTASTAYWAAEDVDTTESEQAFGQVGLTPKSVSGFTAFTKELLQQSSVDVEGLVRDDLMQVLAIGIDKAAIEGTGNSGQPLGLVNVTGIGSVTFSAAATWAKVLEFEKALDLSNVPLKNLGWITTPATKAKWKAAVKVTAQPVYLWDDANKVNGYSATATNQVSSDRVIFANWSNLIIGNWGGIDVVVDPYSLAPSRKVRIVISQMVDVALRHPESFVVSTDSGAQ